ncbi:G-protein coupled receptor [Branchiostoma belcheri]|nr:G-protein coupled receptor [Branchiostoma belcheri]
MANETTASYDGQDFLNGSANGTTADGVFTLHRYKHGAGITGLIIMAYALVFLLCVVGNVIVCGVVIKTPRLRTVTNYFILNLAVSDLLVAIFCMPFTLVEHILTGRHAPLRSVTIDENKLKVAENFTYLGSSTNNKGQMDNKLDCGHGKASAAFNQLGFETYYVEISQEKRKETGITGCF